MQIQEVQQNGAMILSPVGAMSGDDADTVKDRVASLLGGPQPPSGWVLNVARVSGIDSRGLEVLEEISGLLSKVGHSLKLCGANKTLREVLALTDLTSLFEHFEDVTAAVGGSR